MNVGSLIRQRGFGIALTLLGLPAVGHADAPLSTLTREAPAMTHEVNAVPIYPQSAAAARSRVAWPGLPAVEQRAVDAAEVHARRNHPAGDDPHTRWRDADGKPLFTNRLILSPSPYLLEHAHNPVDWYPWGPAALAAAKTQNKPLFISIGYASCHWCHVMAQQSFESPDVARVLNQSFIPVKVDRQQNPELDSRYQIAVAIIDGGKTGWPASIYALPDGRPFFATLYQPEPQFLATVSRVAKVWETRPGAVAQDADRLTGLMRRVLDQQAQAQALDASLITRTAQDLMQQIDPFEGGFGEGVKFPNTERLMFLLDQLGHAALPPEPLASLRDSLNLTLEHMRRGGICDQLGGGFFRYSTTPDWRVPHFEKMAYDQAELARTYLRAGLVLGRRDYWQTAEETLDFVLAHMRAPDGGFIAALDADSALPTGSSASIRNQDAPSQLHEGAFYTWRPSQIEAVLSPADARLAMAYWRISPSGDMEGVSVPHRASAADEALLAKFHHLSPAALSEKMATLRERLNHIRARRPAPRQDGNRIASWNGLLIRALADGGRLLGQPRFVQAAADAARFLDRKMRLPDGGLAHSFNRGVASGVANLADHADYALGLIALYDATGDRTWLKRAEIQAARIRQDFAAPAGGYFDQPTTSSAEGVIQDLPVRPYEDSPEPAGNVQALRLFIALTRRGDAAADMEATESVLAAFSGLIARDPQASTGMLAALTSERMGGIDTQAYGAHGGFHAQIHRRDRGQFDLDLAFSSGWHINAHEARGDLIATRVTAISPLRLALVDYPVGKTMRLAFSDAPLNLYLGKTRITGVVPPDAQAFPQRVRLDYQACNDEICLAPSQVTLWLPPVR